MYYKKKFRRIFNHIHVQDLMQTLKKLSSRLKMKNKLQKFKWKNILRLFEINFQIQDI